MKYYLIFLLKGKVVEIADYDTEEMRDKSLVYYGNWAHGLVVFDELQAFNEVL